MPQSSAQLMRRMAIPFCVGLDFGNLRNHAANSSANASPRA